jgi:predicted CXXCH cytochrome family protein
VLAAILIGLSVSPLLAGDWHYGAHLVCTDCHTNHNSSSGQPMRYDDVADPAHYLLRSDAAQTLCLSCHDGASGSAPDVMGTVTYVSESAAGPFANTGGLRVSTAHNLNQAPEVPPGGTKPMVLTCTTCHDPHGNANYRNLRPDPAVAGTGSSSVVAQQATLPTGNNPAAVYVLSNIIYKSGTSLWCQNCHGAPLEGSDHPDDKPIFGAITASYTRWASVTLPRVPVHSPSDSIVPSTDDRVVCISCHKAHGSANTKTLIYADGATLDSTCQECHDQ